jgi:hypothetical protein
MSRKLRREICPEKEHFNNLKRQKELEMNIFSLDLAVRRSLCFYDESRFNGP